MYDSRGTAVEADDILINGKLALDGFWPYKADMDDWRNLSVKYDKLGFSFVQTYWPIPFSYPKSYISDSPTIPLGNEDSKWQVDDQFNTMVVYRAPEQEVFAPTPNSRAFWIRSIPVALASFNWRLTGTAIKDNSGNWSIDGPSHLSSEPLVTEHRVPTWEYHLCPFVLQNIVPKGVNYR
jgi:hypothetical protein